MLRASEAGIWANCPGSTVLSKVEKDTPEEEEGTLLHLLAMLFATKIKVSDSIEEMNANLEFRTRNETGLLITEEYKNLALEASAFCLSKATTGSMWETPLKGELMPDGVEGTCDFMGYDRDSKTLHVVDLKFGFDIVPAIENQQLLCYSIGAKNLTNGPVEFFELHICQPRDYANGAFKTWRLSHFDWEERVVEFLKAVDLAHEGQYTKTGHWCKYCKSRIFCKAFLDVASHALQTIEVRPEDLLIDSRHLGAEFSYLKRAEEFIVSARKGFEDFIISEIEAGRPVAGWQLGRTSGRRGWSAPIEDIKAVALMSGVTLTRESPIPITDAWRNVAIRPIIETLVSKKEGSKKLVPFDETKIKEKLTHG